MRIASALAAALMAVTMPEAAAHYTVPPTSPLGSSTIPPWAGASSLANERRDSAGVARVGELGEVSLARHLGIGAAIGGVARRHTSRISANFSPDGDLPRHHTRPAGSARG